jgi:hypothetical protein
MRDFLPLYSDERKQLYDFFGNVSLMQPGNRVLANYSFTNDTGQKVSVAIAGQLNGNYTTEHWDYAMKKMMVLPHSSAGECIKYLKMLSGVPTVVERKKCTCDSVDLFRYGCRCGGK